MFESEGAACIMLRAVQTVLVLKDIVRRFPDVAAPYGATIQALPLADLESAEAAAAYLWLRAEMVVQGVADPADAEPVRPPLPPHADAHPCCR